MVELSAIEATLAGMSKAVDLLQRQADKSPSIAEVALSVAALRDITDEKFEGVGTRLNELNTRLTQADSYKQIALDAALKAAQNLVDVQQVNIKESIKKTEDLFTTSIEAIKEKVESLQKVVDRGEGHTKGLGDGWGYLVGAIGAIVGVVAVIELMLRH
jgi:hypothetical protein